MFLEDFKGADEDGNQISPDFRKLLFDAKQYRSSDSITSELTVESESD